MATVAKEIFHGGTGKSEQALQKRNEQRKKWDMSETSRQPATIAQSRQKPRVKFSENIVFLAAAASGDLEDVETLVKAKGADVNCHSKDGLTALHQVSSVMVIYLMVYLVRGRGGGGGERGDTDDYIRRGKKKGERSRMFASEDYKNLF